MLKKWYEMNSFEFDVSNSIGLIVVGSCEQHSKHLPLGTDGMLGEKIGILAGEKANCQVVLLPTQYIGFSPHHKEFKGYITLNQKTMFQYLVEVCLCAYENGLEKLVILNAHGGNQSILQSVVNELGSVYHKKAILVRYWDLIKKEIQDIRDTDMGGMGHACEFETSLMLYLSPHLVSLNNIEDTSTSDGNHWHNPDMFSSNSIYLYKPFYEYSELGIIGQPQFASKEKGEKITKLLLEKLSSLFEFYLENDF